MLLPGCAGSGTHAAHTARARMCAWSAAAAACSVQVRCRITRRPAPPPTCLSGSMSPVTTQSRSLFQHDSPLAKLPNTCRHPQARQRRVARARVCVLGASIPAAACCDKPACRSRACTAWEQMALPLTSRASSVDPLKGCNARSAALGHAWRPGIRPCNDPCAPVRRRSSW